MSEKTRESLPRVAALGGTRGVGLGAAWHHDRLARLVAVCDIRPEAAEQRLAASGLAGPDGPSLFTDSEAMLRWGEFDAVIVATPDATHYALARRVLESGFHCFVEKPMTTTVDDARALVGLWRDSGRLGVVGHEFRHASMVSAARRKIAAGVIGTPRLAVTMDACGRMGSYWRRRAWRDDVRPPDNSLTLQKAIHQLDIQSFLMDSRPRRVYASAGADHYGGDKPGDLRCADCAEADACPYHASRMRINYEPVVKPAGDGLCVYARNVHLHDNQAVVIDYENGARGSYVECFFTPDYKVEHTVIGDRGRLTMRYSFRNPLQEIVIDWIGRCESERLVCPAVGGHGGGDHILARAFTAGLAAGTPVQPDLVEGCWAVALARSIDEAAASGQPVLLPPDLPGGRRPGQSS